MDYIHATRNEIAIDETVLQAAGLDADINGHLPRALKWITHARRHPRLVHIFARLAWLFWVAGGNAIFLLLEFFPWWLRALYRPSENNIPPTGRHALALSPRAGAIIQALPDDDLPDSWMTVPWVTLHEIPPSVRHIDTFSLLSPRELLRALHNSLTAQQHLLRHPDTRKWALQGYTAFKWFAVRIAIDKVPGDFVMVNHFDRWAILADRSAQHLGRSLTLVQHGTVSRLDTRHTAAPLVQNIPQKLGAVRELYVYNRDEEQIFRRYILRARLRIACA